MQCGAEKGDVLEIDILDLVPRKSEGSILITAITRFYMLIESPDSFLSLIDICSFENSIRLIHWLITDDTEFLP